MDISLLFIYLFVIFISFIMFEMSYTSSVIVGTGGIIASSFWMYQVYLKGIKGNDFEFLAAFSWFIFSIVVIFSDFYGERNIFIA